MSIELIEGQPVPRDSTVDRKRVLVCLGRYLPGNKDGGPIRSIANMVANLSPYYDFYVVTQDRDVMDMDTYPGVTPNRWHRVGCASVLYCSSVGPAILYRAYKDVLPDLIYLNGCWDVFTRLMVTLRRVGALGNTPMLVAPRGELSPGAMEIKRPKKILYRQSAKLLGLYNNLLWQASTPREKQAVLQGAPVWRLDPDTVHVAYTMSDAIPSSDAHPPKHPGAVKLVFISRITEMKNLYFLLELLREVRGEIELNLFGPVPLNDSAYWESCSRIAMQLPSRVKVAYHGSIGHSLVASVLHEHHFFVLPTRGENFCHAAVESFVSGTPVVLSDQTPWTDLGEGCAGFDIALDDRGKWVAALQTCVDMDQNTYANYLDGAREYGRRFSVEEAVRQHRAMFQAAFSTSANSQGV